MGRHAGKEIMSVEICEAEADHTWNPADAAECGRHLVTEPTDEAELAEECGHHYQCPKPDEGVPCSMFAAEFIPGEHTCQKESCCGQECRCRRIEIERCSQNPEHNHDDRYHAHQFLVALHRAKAC